MFDESDGDNKASVDMVVSKQRAKMTEATRFRLRHRKGEKQNQIVVGGFGILRSPNHLLPSAPILQEAQRGRTCRVVGILVVLHPTYGVIAAIEVFSTTGWIRDARYDC